MLIEYLYFLAVGLSFSFTLWAAWSDFRSLTIPNWISVGILLLFPLVIVTSPMAIQWYWSIAVFAAVLASGFLLFALKALGGGDVKLISVLSLWAGVDKVLPFLMATVLVGGVLVAIMFVNNVVRNKGKGGSYLISARETLSDKAPVPYGIAIAFGSFPIFYHYASLSGVFQSLFNLTGN
ncbi:MAG: prepilin peptidase [Sneathiella sp.]